MKLTDYADAINKVLIMRYIPNVGFFVTFEDSRITGNEVMEYINVSGTDLNINVAMREYVEKIKGKILIFGKDDNLQRHKVPSHLTLD